MAEQAFEAGVRDAVWQAARTRRSEVFGASNVVPANADENFETSWPGFVGSSYRSGGVLLVAHFPAGGTTPFQGTERDLRSRRLYEAARALRDTPPTTRQRAYDHLMDVGAADIPHWRMMKVVETVLHACDLRLQDIALINVVPFRIADNKKPGRAVLDRAWALCTGPLVAALAPARVAALGAATGDALAGRIERAKLFILPRRIGDSSVHPEARTAAHQLARWL